MKKKPAPSPLPKKSPKNPAGTKKGQKKTEISPLPEPVMDWEAVFRVIGSPALILGRDHAILSANDATCRLTGKSEAELRGMKCWDVFHGSGRGCPPPGCPMVRLLASGKHETAEMEVAMDGRVCLVSCTPVLDEQGSIRSVIHIATDITEKKKTEQRVQESEDRFRKIFENSPLGMALVTPDFRFFSVNPAWVSMTGYPEKELLKMSFTDITHPDHLTGDVESIRTLASGSMPVYSTEKRYVRKDGSSIWGHIRVTAIRDPGGSLCHFAAQIENITERKQAEQGLVQKNRELQTINELAIEFGSLSSGKSVTELAVKKLMQLSGGVMASFSVYDPAERVLQITDFEIAPGMLEKITRVLGRRPLGLKIPVSAGIYEEIITHAVGIRKTITEVTFGEIPPLISTSIQKLTGIDHFIGIAYVVGGELYGTSILAIKHGQTDPPSGLLESFAHIVAVSLRRYRVEVILSESEDRYRNIVADTQAGYFQIDTDGRFTRVNPAWLGMHGFSSETEVIGKHFSITQVDTDQHAAQEMVERLLRGERIPRGEFSRRRKDGSVGYHLFSASPVIKEGRVEGLEGFLIDITDRKIAEDALRESDKQYRSLYQNAAIGIFHSSTDGRFIDVNPALATMLGYPSPEEVVTSITSMAEQVYAEPPRYDAVATALLNSGGIFSTENRYRKRDGTFWYGMLHVRIVPDNQGMPHHHEGFVEDITERKRAEERLRESENKFTTVFRSSPVALTLVSASDGKFVDVNDAFIRNSGYAAKEIIGKTSEQMDLFPDAGERMRMITSLRDQQVINGMELKCRIKTGEVLTCLVSSGFIRMGEKSYILSSIENITERKRAEAALRESEEKYRTVFENTGTAMLVMEKDTMISLVNEEFVRLSGFSKNEIEKKKSWTEFVVKEDLERMLVQHRLRRKNTKKALTHYEFRFVTKPGEIRDIYLTIDVIPGTEKSVASLLDITGRKRAEEALRESEQKFRETIKSLDEGYYSSTLDGLLLEHNVAFNRILKIDGDRDLKGTRLPDFWQNPSDRNEYVEKLLAEGSVRDFPMRAKTVTGEKIFILGNSHLVRNDAGKVLRIEGVVKDFTAQKQAEEALCQKTEELDNRNRLISTLLDTIPIGIFMVESPMGRPILANKEATRLLGRGILPDVTETNLAELYEAYKIGTTERYPTREMPVVRGLKGESSHIDDMEVARPDGTHVLLEVLGNPILDSHNRIVASLVSFLDITERRQAEELRERFIHDLAQKNAELDRFTYTVSHDLKTPLIAIRSYISLLEDDLKAGDSVQVQADIRWLSESAGKLENLITTLLTLSRSGRTVDEPVNIPFSDIALEAARLLESTLRDRGVKLSVPDNLPVISGDRQRLLQVMTNLFDNAIKFMGDQKEPVITMGVRDDPEPFIFFVSDNGIGIRKENLPKLFGLYERFTPEIPGSGIGLATVKRIIGAHGGKIWVESEGEGKGTTIFFTLPGAGHAGTDKDNNG